MNLINQYLEPGTYQEISTKDVIVVLDVINYKYDFATTSQLLEMDPLVVYRTLDMVIEHKRFSTQLSIFKTLFKKI